MSGTVSPRRRFLMTQARATAGIAMLTSGSGMKTASAGALAGKPNPPDSVELAFHQTSQSLFKARTDAVYRSSDGGRQWTSVDLPPASSSRGVQSIAVSAGGKGALYVAGRGIGVLRSDDGGRNWSAHNEGLTDTNVTALATHADRPETVYAYINDRGIFRSEDGGQRWRLMDAGPRGGVTRFVHSNMPGSMQSGWLFVAGPHGVRRAMDCFCSADRRRGP